MLINKVSDYACQWNGHDIVISIGRIFFIERFVCCMTKKSWAFSDLVAAISAALHETFVRSKDASSVSQFLLYLWRFCSTTEGVSTVLLSFLCLWNVRGVGAFDHLNGPQCGEFERHFGPDMGEFEQQFSKKSNARVVARGGACWSFDLTDTLLESTVFCVLEYSVYSVF